MDSNLQRSSKQKFFEYAQYLMIIALFVSTYWFFSVIGEDTIREYVRSLGVFGPLAFIFIHTLSIIVAPLEGSFLMLAANGIFGNFWVAVAVVMIGGFLGSSINFWIARLYGKKIITRFIGQKMAIQLDSYSKTVNARPLLLFPLMATSLFDIMGYAAGLTSIKYRNFMLAVALSSIINVPIYVAIGSSILSKDLGIKVVAILALVITVFVLLKWLLERYMQTKILKVK